MASRAMLEALLARVQKRASEPRSSSVAVIPILEAASGGTNGAHHDGLRANDVLRAGDVVARDVMNRDVMNRDVVERGVIERNVVPDDELDDDIEEYDDELIEIIDDAEVIPQAAAAVRAIEPNAFGAAVDRRPASAAQPEPVAARPEPLTVPSAPARPAQAPASERLRAEAVAPRPIAATEVARTRGARRELRSTPFIELLDASLELG